MKKNLDRLFKYLYKIKESSKYSKHFNRDEITCSDITCAITDLNMIDVTYYKIYF